MSAEVSNRRRGAAIVVGSSSILLSELLLDILLANRAGIFFRALLPFVGLVLPMGVYMLVTDRGADDFRSGHTPPATARRLLGVMVASALLGLAGNRWIAGRPQ